ncbi:MAG: hypothetical protein HYS35_04980 [Betaproteobacteria bacterium]|nr:hypothetical protein [Betaproteobacteria bacterium]
MKDTVRKPNPELEFLNARLGQMGLSERERLMAEARLARAEAIAELLVRMTGAVKRLFRAVLLRPIRRLTSALG